MDRVKAIDFYREWKKAVMHRKQEILQIWRKKKEFTLFIKGSENSIIDQVANSLDLLSYPQDYYSIDTILYKQQDLVPKIKESSYWFRDIRVAFEHENDFNSGLYQEVSHLLITNCDLKVLVSYPDYEPDNELEYLHEIIKGTKHSKYISEKENFLIIFGYENNFEWEGYVYNEKEWIKYSE